MPFPLFILFFILQRTSELFVARRNEQWLRAKGAIEYGKGHYYIIVFLHSLFIGSMIGEFWVKPNSNFDPIFFILFIILLSLKIWIIRSLGKYWNTKILRIPGSPPIKKGLYKYVRHPNYIIVICEFIVVPMVFHLYVTAILFSILNAIVLRIRITEENKVWSN